MLHNWDCVAIFEILVSVFLQAGVSTVFRWPDRMIWVSKSENVPNLKDRESVTNTVENVSQGHSNVKSPKKNLWPVMPLAHSGSQHVWLERCQGQWPPWEMPSVEINKHGLNTTTQQVLSGFCEEDNCGFKGLLKLDVLAGSSCESESKQERARRERTICNSGCTLDSARGAF